MNKVILIGRMTRLPEIRYTYDQKKVASFTLAVDGYGDRTDFIDCVTFNRADFIEKYGDKGLKLACVGRLQVDQYQDKEGNNRRSTRVVVSECEFCESKKSSERASEAPASVPEAPASDLDTEGFFPFSDDIEELPFV